MAVVGSVKIVLVWCAGATWDTTATHDVCRVSATSMVLRARCVRWAAASVHANPTTMASTVTSVPTDTTTSHDAHVRNSLYAPSLNTVFISQICCHGSALKLYVVDFGI